MIGRVRRGRGRARGRDRPRRRRAADARRRRASSCACSSRLRIGRRTAGGADTVEQAIEAAIRRLRARRRRRRPRDGLAAPRLGAREACRFGDAAEALDAGDRARAARGRRPAGAARRDGIRAAAAATGRRRSTRRSTAARRAMEQTAGDRQSEGHLLAVLAGLYAMQGAFEHARWTGGAEPVALRGARARHGTARARDGGAGASSGSAGDLEGAARELRSSYDALDAVGETYLRSTVAGLLAQTLLEQGALEEASAFCERSRELADRGDIATQALWRYVRGRILVPAGSAPPKPSTSPARRSGTARADRRDRVPDRGRARARRGSRRDRPDRRGARGLRGSARAGRAEGRRRDPHWRAPPSSRFSTPPATTIAALFHQSPRPVRLGRGDDLPDARLPVELDRRDALVVARRTSPT